MLGAVRYLWARILVSVAAIVVAAIAPAEARSTLSRAEAFAQAKALSALGSKLFRDPSLSASGKLACASCHDPANAFGPDGVEPVALGGRDMHHLGLRAVPSLRYLQTVPQFTEHYYDSDDEG
ncbi:MAG: cytochrome c peroxidase, partial [Stellaceae bacterium]